MAIHQSNHTHTAETTSITNRSVRKQMFVVEMLCVANRIILLRNTHVLCISGDFI